jgi:hypothetical protein
MRRLSGAEQAQRRLSGAEQAQRRLSGAEQAERRLSGAEQAEMIDGGLPRHYPIAPRDGIVRQEDPSASTSGFSTAS